MENIQPGWSRRRSGILVPRRRRRGRLAAAGTILLGVVMVASSVGTGVSSIARAVMDVAQAVTVLITAGERTSCE